ncbi:MAG: helix-turn-helix domain-containing protein [Bacillota bacterium]|nr:helix-turn-helix domain-containing protein [Bacillota bacterium]
MKFDYIRFSIKKQESVEEVTKDVVILLNLDGNMNVSMNQKEYILRKSEVIIINSLNPFSCISDEGVYVLFYIQKEKLQECFDDKKYIFECNPRMEIHNTDSLKNILFEILVASYQKNKYYYIKMNQLFYELTIVLLRSFAIQSLDNTLDKKQELIEFVELNYEKELSLEEVADRFHMSKYYFSKYFKKYMDSSYYQYVVDVRLKHAIFDVENSEKKILQIAMDHGFSNLTSFNHYFKEKYGMNPKEYRLLHKQESQAIQLEQDLKYIIENFELNNTTDGNEIVAHMDSDVAVQCHSFWSELLNFGKLSYLDDIQIVNHLQSIQKEIGFRYLRVQFDDYAYVADHPSFSKEERQLDEIIDMNFIPWIVIDYRRIQNIDVICDYFQKFLSHFVNRYSIFRIREWRVELVYNTIFDTKKMESYLEAYRRFQDIMDHFEINMKLMGAGLSLGNREGILRYFECLEKKGMVIENQTFQAEPYIYYKNEQGILLCKPNDNMDIHQDIVQLKRLNTEYEKYIKHTYLVSYRDDIMPLNLLNDSCRKGAYIIQQILNCYGQVDSLSGYIPLDAMYEYDVQKEVLFGGEGLISYQGIHKPSFYAYSFLNKTRELFLYKNENAIFFKNLYGNYQIVAHNCKNLGYNYYLENENLNYRNIDSYFENNDVLRIHVKIDHVQNGTYIIKQRTVSKQGGSVQDELYRMMDNKSTYFHPNDLQYLESISVPKMRLKTVMVENNTFETIIELEANEFAYLHIIHQY